jgi:hypothetical protein
MEAVIVIIGRAAAAVAVAAAVALTAAAALTATGAAALIALVLVVATLLPALHAIKGTAIFGTTCAILGARAIWDR